jgi:hypothetical protein
VSNRRRVKRWRLANGEKIAAQRKLQRAVQLGEVRKPAICEVLGCTRSKRLQGHHHDYRRPRDVIFLCHRHHMAVHSSGPQPLKPGSRRKFVRAPIGSTSQ